MCIRDRSIVTYFAILLIVVIYIILFKTKMGLSICAVGESEIAAKTAGIKPAVVKWQVILISGALSAVSYTHLKSESRAMRSSGRWQKTHAGSAISVV